MAETTKEVVENGGLSGGTGKSSGEGNGGSKGNGERPSEKTGGKSGQVNGDVGGSSSKDGGQGGTDNRGSNGQRGGSNLGNTPSAGGSNRRNTGSNGTSNTGAAPSNTGNVGENKIVPPSVTNGLETKAPKNVRPSRAASAKAGAAKKDTGDITDAETLSVLIQTGFGMLAGVTRRKHWEIQEDEAVSIAKPASNMIQKLTSKQKQKINQLAAPIMLVSAIASVVVPRLIIDMAMAKETNQNERVKKQVSQNLNGDAKQNVDESGNVGIVQTNSNDSTSVSTTVDSEIAGLFSRMD
jgi:hypothetical protein